ncbi:sugar phosphate nucleotidyltransferase [Flavobacteriaceae bacterium]|nr:sugar phosphate nucleotidyltransferase [Flavobacteriaceae bacterium]
MQALILAGGKGTRLMPYTANLPKPLMPIDNMPILEVIVKQLKFFGVKSIIMAVGHLHHMIEAYFKDGADFGISIKYSLETEPLGTAGPISLVMNDLENDFLVLNGDLLTSIDFQKIYNTHILEKSSATIATFSRKVNIDFGVLELDEKSELRNYTEKPTFDYKVSMGINVFNKASIKNLVKKNEYLDIPNLMIKLKNSGHKVLCHEQDCKWLDIGRVDDYEVAHKVFSEDRDIFLPSR